MLVIILINKGKKAMLANSKPDILYLGSQSSARRRLLDYAKINYQIISHASNEKLTCLPAKFQDHVLAIAQHKMQTLNLPDTSSLDIDQLYALSADTS